MNSKDTLKRDEKGATPRLGLGDPFGAPAEAMLSLLLKACCLFSVSASSVLSKRVKRQRPSFA